MAHDMEISFFVDKKSKNFCAGGITERQTRKVTETQKKMFMFSRRNNNILSNNYFLSLFGKNGKRFVVAIVSVCVHITQMNS